jgi:hypothetical protein
MTDPQPQSTDPGWQVRQILADLITKVNSAVDAIHQIAEREIEHSGEGTPAGEAWSSFASESEFSDVGRAATAMLWQIAAVRGQMVYRGLDSDHKDYALLSDADTQQGS